MAFADLIDALNIEVVSAFSARPIVEFLPTEGGSQLVSVVWRNPERPGPDGISGAATIWGTEAGAGWSRTPAKNDVFSVGGTEYRVADVVMEDEGAGVRCLLTR